MDVAEIRMVNGDLFTVEGEPAEIERALSDAGRSGQSRLAWFTEHGTDARLGINPAQVTALRIGEARAGRQPP